MTTNPDTTHPTAAPERTHPVQLSGAAAAVWAALNTHPGATIATIAAAAGAGRSTTTKALRDFEQTGLARRKTAIPQGNGRPKNHWYAMPPMDHESSTSTDAADELSAEDTAVTVSSPDPEHAADTTEPSLSGDDKQESDAADSEATQGRQDLQPESRDEPLQATEADDSPTRASALATPAEEAKPTAEPENPQPTAPSSGHRTRLAPGALRQMVIDHLTAHPDEAFTATRISRTIEKSSGAIANALATLAKQSIAEQVTEHPRTYRRAARPASYDA